MAEWKLVPVAEVSREMADAIDEAVYQWCLLRYKRVPNGVKKPDADGYFWRDDK